MLELLNHLKNSDIIHISFISFYKNIYIDSVSNLPSSFFDYLLSNSDIGVKVWNKKIMNYVQINESINYA